MIYLLIFKSNMEHILGLQRLFLAIKHLLVNLKRFIIYQATLNLKIIHLGTGVLIDHQHVLTTAHKLNGSL